MEIKRIISRKYIAIVTIILLISTVIIPFVSADNQAEQKPVEIKEIKSRS